jgi:hypothetical protein
MFVWCAAVQIDVFFCHRLSLGIRRWQSVVCYSLGALILSFLKHKSLIYYQRDSAKAEPIQDPFLSAEIHSC